MFDIQAKAIQFLLDNKINSFPIDPINIVKNNKDNGWAFASIDRDKNLLAEIGALEYSIGKKSFTAITDYGKTIIFLADNLPYNEKKRLVWNEIGHIVLGHSSSVGILGSPDDKDTNERQEKETEQFSLYAAAPVCVLRKAGFMTPHQIEKITQIPNEMAIKTVKAILNEEDSGGNGMRIELENQLCTQFAPFIYKENKRVSHKLDTLTLKPVHILTLVVAIVAITAFTTYKLYSSQPTFTADTNIPVDNYNALQLPIHTDIITNAPSETEIDLTELSTTEPIVTSTTAPTAESYPIATIEPTPIATPTIEPVPIVEPTSTPMPIVTPAPVESTVVPTSTPTPPPTPEPTVAPAVNNEITLISMTTPTGRNKNATVSIKV